MPTLEQDRADLEDARDRLYQIIETCEKQILNGDVQCADLTVEYLRKRYCLTPESETSSFTS